MQLSRGIKLYVITISILLAGACNAFAQDDKEEMGEVTIEVKPGNKNAIFKDNENVDYKLKIKSTYQTAQDGKLTYNILTDDFTKISTNSIPVHLTKNSAETYSVNIPKKAAGFYRVHFILNTTTYDDTVKKVFGVSPEKIVTQLHRPADFDAFWKGSLDTLKQIAPNYKVIFRKDLSTKAKKVYLVEMRSYENVLIRGWLVIPTYNAKSLPVHYRLPGYVVALKPNMDNDDFIAFDLNVRGNGNARDEIAVGTETYCLINIENRNKYIYRGIYMDCIRGLDFLMSHKSLGIDTSRIYIEAGSQGAALGIATAGLDKRVTVLTIQVPLYADIRDSWHISSFYNEQVFPFKQFRNYNRSHPDFTWDKFFKLFDYFDPQNFAPNIKCPVLMGVGLLDQFCPPRCSLAMYNHLGTKPGEKEWVSVPNSTHEVNFDYFTFQNNWLREKFRIP
jgi:cephalosporin-C deacetylase